MTTRMPGEVVAHHGQSLGAENLEEIVADYAQDADLRLVCDGTHADEVFALVDRLDPRVETVADPQTVLPGPVGASSGSLIQDCTRECPRDPRLT